MSDGNGSVLPHIVPQSQIIEVRLQFNPATGQIQAMVPNQLDVVKDGLPLAAAMLELAKGIIMSAHQKTLTEHPLVMASGVRLAQS